ncbi:MAG: 3-methyl-2-oxobutanoate hydroxymethyltransferase [candidate division WOR-3 bacterium]|nr:3-methyl-2-oxobutanoate hydroxymethyltransferase [candidate division WOR-3 bacterium]MDW8114548.1 3-methyl-2-oxobutanoate hydroxymethyltransferase [candidate division WOR-3 bacterium]
MRITIDVLSKMKERKEKIVALTAYDYLSARILDESGIDLILVGDSAANVIFGYETTLQIDLSAMLMFTSAVARGVKRALVVGDMPFLSYQISKEEALKNAGLFLKAGAQAVKLEGGEPVLPIIEHLVKFGIPVMGHLGLTPQFVHQLGGYKLQARTKEEQEKLLKEAILLESAGCFALVLEKIPMEVSKMVTERLKIPTIGIGAGPYCDGQILVLQDMLGLNEKKFKFVKKYADLANIIKKAVKEYLEEVKRGEFPKEEHSFKADESC